MNKEKDIQPDQNSKEEVANEVQESQNRSGSNQETAEQHKTEDEVNDFEEAELSEVERQLQGQLQETEEKLEEVIAENDKLNDKFTRLAAEFNNYKKRTRKEERERLKYEGKSILKELLPVFDDIDRAVEHQQNANKDKKDEEDQEKVYDTGGLEMIHKKLHKVLNDLGVVKYDSVGDEFDPELHHAIMTKKDEEHEPDIVLEEIEKGYKYKDKVLRYAKVIVSK